MRVKMWIAFSWTVTVGLFISFNTALAGLTIIPRDTETRIGDSVYLNCSTDMTSKTIHWKHGEKFVYTGTFNDPYLGRFQLEGKESSGTFNLVVSSVESGDAGSYSCRDDGGHGQSHSAELVVLETDPVCQSNIELDGVIGPNSCNMEPDEVTLSCSGTYAGNIPPKMKWKRSSDYYTTPTAKGVEAVATGKKYNYTFTFNASDLMNNNRSFVCETTQSTTFPYNCSTPAVKILYAFSNNYTLRCTMGEKIVCSANTSLSSCNYKWRWYDKDDVLTVSNDAILNPDKPGNYRCEADCLIRNTPCVFVAMSVGVTATSESTSSSIWWVVLVIILMVIIIAAVAVAIWILKRRRNQKQEIQTKIVYSTTQQPLLPSSIKEDETRESTGGEKTVTEKKLPEAKDDVTSMNKELNKIDRAIARMVCEEKMIKGVAISKDKIYVLVVSNSTDAELNFYDSLSCDTKGSRLLGGELLNPFDMAYCSANRRIYIMDSTREGVGRKIVLFDEHGTKIAEWSTKQNFHGLTVSQPDCNIILTARDTLTVAVYLPDGTEVRTIELKPVHPHYRLQCVIQIQNEVLLASHTGKDPGVCSVKFRPQNQESKSVCYGQLLKTFGKGKGINQDQMNEPRCLTVNSQGDIYILDTENNRISILTSDLEFKQVILLGALGLKSPVKMSLDDSVGRLVVAGELVTDDKTKEKGPGILLIPIPYNM